MAAKPFNGLKLKSIPYLFYDLFGKEKWEE
jgi:hypothetical protein